MLPLYIYLFCVIIIPSATSQPINTISVCIKLRVSVSIFVSVCLRNSVYLASVFVRDYFRSDSVSDDKMPDIETEERFFGPFLSVFISVSLAL